MLIITTIFIVLLISGIIYNKIRKEPNDSPILIFCMSVILFAILFIGIPLSKCEDRNMMEDIKIFQMTIEEQRKQGNYLENATITNEIIDYNQWIYRIKRHNTFWRSYFWTDQSIDTLKFIK